MTGTLLASRGVVETRRGRPSRGVRGMTTRLARPDRGATRRCQTGSEGIYQRHIEDLQRRKRADADQPYQVSYKKLVRA